MQEKFEVVLKKLQEKLKAKHKEVNLEDFVETANKIYVEQELISHKVNEELIAFLKQEIKRVNG